MVLKMIAGFLCGNVLFLVVVYQQDMQSVRTETGVSSRKVYLTTVSVNLLFGDYW